MGWDLGKWEQLGVAAQKNERECPDTRDRQQQPGMQRRESTGMLGSLFWEAEAQP